MKIPLLFDKRHRVAAQDAAQYVGTENEIDPKGSDRELKTSIRRLVRSDELRPDVDGRRRS